MRNYYFILIILLEMFTTTLTAQKTQIKGFINVDASAVFDTTYRNQFTLGQFDLFITSQVSNKISFIGETIFKYETNDKHDDGFEIGIERAIVNYKLKDYFNLSAGKFYTPLGYWNNVFHHGIVLQPTITNPKVVNETANGGGLPLEDIGVQFNGDGITKLKLGYNLMIGNGISSNPIEDFNNSKSVCLNIHVEPKENLNFHISGYFDNISKGTTTVQNIITTQNINLQILNASIAYWDGELPIELIGEYFNLKTIMLDSNTTAYSNGYFIYFGYKIKKINLTPYMYYDRLILANNDQLFFPNSTTSYVLGLRYAIQPLCVLKLEYKYSETKILNYQNRIELQFAIGF